MKDFFQITSPKPLLIVLFQRIIIILLFALMTGCSLLNGDSSEDDETLRQTQIALAVQQTRLAEQEAEQTRLSDQVPQDPGGDVNTPESPTTQAELQPTQAIIETEAVIPPTVQDPQDQPALTATTEIVTLPEDFQTMMKNASILVYEDMANDPSEYFYVQRTLDYMGLNYKWDGSAKGTFKSDLLGGARGGPWDLVIVAVEYRAGIQGEFFEYLGDILNQGSSLIMEAWHLDQISSGTVSNILQRCGVQVYEYFPKTGTANDVVVWPISGASGHPLLSDPNSGLSFTKARTKWLPSGDLGDLMALTGSGDAQFLMATAATKQDRDAVLATCMNGQVTLQTFSSHSFPYNVVSPLWENMITNALKVRLLGNQ